MYNRYIPRDSCYIPVHNEGAGEEQRSKRHVGKETGRGGEKERAASGTALHMDKNAGIAGILKALKIEQLDSGDLLLMVIVLLLFMEGDNTELVITLGLLLLLGLGEQQEGSQKE